MKKFILLVYCTATLWTMLLCGVSSAQQPIQSGQFGSQRVYVQPKMSVKTSKLYIRGFPAIVELQVKGSAVIEPASRLSTIDDMKAIFSSKEDGNQLSK